MGLKDLSSAFIQKLIYAKCCLNVHLKFGFMFFGINFTFRGQAIIVKYLTWLPQSPNLTTSNQFSEA